MEKSHDEFDVGEKSLSMNVLLLRLYMYVSSVEWSELARPKVYKLSCNQKKPSKLVRFLSILGLSMH